MWIVILIIALIEALIIGWLIPITLNIKRLEGKIEQPWLNEDTNGLYKLIMSQEEDLRKFRETLYKRTKKVISKNKIVKKLKEKKAK